MKPLFFHASVFLFLCLSFAQSDLTVIKCPFNRECTCTGDVSDNRHFLLATCQFSDTSAFPTFAGNQTKWYNVDSMVITSKIDAIPKDAFAVFEYIGHLSMVHSGDARDRVNWNEEAFRENLTSILDVNDLCIFPLPEAVQKLNNGLKSLYASNCSSPTTLGEDSLRYLANLNFLSIDRSPIEKIDEKLLNYYGRNLKELSLTSANLTKPPYLQNSAVQILNISFNQIKVINGDSFGRNYKTIDLRGNPINTIDGGFYFGETINTTEINLQNTNLKSIDLSLFENMPSVNRLVFDDNSELTSLVVTDWDYFYWPRAVTIEVSVKNTKLISIDPRVDNLMESRPKLKIDIENNPNLHCTSDMAWMAKRAMCNASLNIDNAYCFRTKEPLKDFLKKLVPDPCAVATTTSITTSTPTLTTTTRKTSGTSKISGQIFSLALSIVLFIAVR